MGNERDHMDQITADQVITAYEIFLQCEEEVYNSSERKIRMTTLIDAKARAIQAELEGAPPAVISRNIAAKLVDESQLLREADESERLARHDARVAAIRVDMLNHLITLQSTAAKGG